LVTEINGAFAARRAGTVIATAGQDAEGGMFTIGALSREFGVTLRALRFYESKGMITPQRNGAVRLYSAADRERLALILTGKRLGFSLAEIRRMVADRAGRGGHLGLSRDACLEQIAMLEEQKRGLEAGLAELRRIHAALAADAVEPGRVAC
jgi:DNA-binding transcriptional MerR regulator